MSIHHFLVTHFYIHYTYYETVYLSFSLSNHFGTCSEDKHFLSRVWKGQCMLPSLEELVLPLDYPLNYRQMFTRLWLNPPRHMCGVWYALYLNSQGMIRRRVVVKYQHVTLHSFLLSSAMRLRGNPESFGRNNNPQCCNFIGKGQNFVSSKKSIDKIMIINHHHHLRIKLVIGEHVQSTQLTNITFDQWKALFYFIYCGSFLD